LSITGKKRIGILGGSFNPIHNAHLSLSRQAAGALGLDRVILIPTGDSPYKDYGSVTREDRYRMTCLAAQGDSLFTVERIEIDRPGQSYTCDTMRELREREDAEYYFISGSDILFQLGDWMRSEELMKLTRFAFALRRNVDNSSCLREAERLSLGYGAGIVLLEDITVEGISSTMVREAAACGTDFRDMVPEAVADYIISKELYC